MATCTKSTPSVGTVPFEALRAGDHFSYPGAGIKRAVKLQRALTTATGRHITAVDVASGRPWMVAGYHHVVPLDRDPPEPTFTLARAVADHERRIRDIEETTIDALNAAGERICEARNAPAPRHPVETRYAVRYTPRNGDQKPRYATTNRFSWAWRAPAEVWKRIEDLTSPVDAFRAAEREFPKHTSVHSVRLVAFRKWSDDTVTAEEV